MPASCVSACALMYVLYIRMSVRAGVVMYHIIILMSVFFIYNIF